MENNENNIQEKVNQAQENEKKSNGGKMKGFVIIVLLVLCLAIGITVGIILAKDGNPFNKNGGNNGANNTATNNVVETKSGKKIDESKPWVYDAEYGNGKKAKTITNNMGTVYNSTDELIVPYINVNSEYAKSVNEELKALFEKEYNAFGGANPELKISEGYLPKIQYQFSAYNDILSLSVQKFTGVINGDGSVKYYTYNINLNTLDKASLADVYTAVGFSSESYFKESVENTVANEIAEGNLVKEDVKLDYKLFFIDKNKVFNLVLTSPSGNPGAYHIIPGTEKKTSTLNNNSNSDNGNKTSSYSYKEEYTKIVDQYMSENVDSKDIKFDLIYFDNDDIPELVVGKPSYWVTVYTYKNGKLSCPINNWPYGISGNTGYNYLERRAIISNHNSDYAGAISNDSILILNSKNEFDKLLKIGEGVTLESTDEMYERVQKDLAEVAGYYYNDKKISEQEYNNKLKELSIDSNTRFKVLDGSKTNEEIKKELQK